MKNQIVILSAFVVILATGTLVGTYNIQTVKADIFGKVASGQARDGVGNNNNPANGNGLGATTSGQANPAENGGHTGQEPGALGAAVKHCATTQSC